MNITAETKHKPVRYRLKTAGTLIDDVMKIIKLDIQKGIDEGVGVDGKNLPKLERRTVYRKKRPHPVKDPGRLGIPAPPSHHAKVKRVARIISPFPDKALVDSGNLIFNQSIKINGNAGEMRVGPTRKQIAMYLQVVGVGKKKKRFIFFGISDRADARIRRYLMNKFQGSTVEKISG